MKIALYLYLKIWIAYMCLPSLVVHSLVNITKRVSIYRYIHQLFYSNNKITLISIYVVNNIHLSCYRTELKLSFLSIDDVKDTSTHRDGVPVAHSIYGAASTINAANLMIFLTQEKILQLNHASVTERFNSSFVC